MKPTDVTSDSCAENNEHSNKKVPNLKFVLMSEYQNTKTFLLKDILQIGKKKFLSLVKLKIQLQTYAISDLKSEKIAGNFCEKELEKTSQKKFRIEKVLKRKGDKLYVKWKGYDN